MDPKKVCPLLQLCLACFSIPTIPSCFCFWAFYPSIYFQVTVLKRYSLESKNCTYDSTGISSATCRTGIFFSKGERKEVPGRIRSVSSPGCSLHLWSFLGGNVVVGICGCELTLEIRQGLVKALKHHQMYSTSRQHLYQQELLTELALITQISAQSSFFPC